MEAASLRPSRFGYLPEFVAGVDHIKAFAKLLGPIWRAIKSQPTLNALVQPIQSLLGKRADRRNKNEIRRSSIRFNDEIGRLDKFHPSISWGDRLLTLDKHCSFKSDRAFDQAFKSIRGSHQYDQYDGPDGIAWRLNTLCWAARCALRVGGDFIECGVFKGDMSWVVAQAIGAGEIPHFYLFDSFAGFSSSHSSQSDFPDSPNFLEFANKIYRAEGLYESVKDRFAPYKNFTVIKGFLPDALDHARPERIGYLHLDLNSARAEIAVLEQLFDRVVPGGVIVFDDYGWWQYRHQKRAEDDFMKSRGYEILELPTGQGVVVKR
jgi:O-methyltransferase